MDILIRTAAGIQPKAVGKKDQTKKTSKTSFQESINDSIDVHEDSALSSVAMPQSVDALFLCLSRAPRRGNREALEEGHSILDALGAVRLGLLQGRISQQNLQDLQAILSSEVSDFQDISPDLKDLIQEIQTRAAVELAKLERV